jgi:DNA-binding NtrC family response regulator
MTSGSVLIVDDESNIRLTLSRALETLQVAIDTAASGEEALDKLRARDYDLVILDLRMAGLSGMDVLARLREIRPDIRVIIMTAYGTIGSAVEAMKLGATDFLEKPFVPEEIRKLVSRVLDRRKLDEKKAADYATFVELAKRAVNERHVEAAIEHLRRAIALEPGRAEAFNLLGVLMEIRGDRLEAQKNYRAAISLEPTYKPALDNLQRSTTWRPGLK